MNNKITAALAAAVIILALTLYLLLCPNSGKHTPFTTQPADSPTPRPLDAQQFAQIVALGSSSHSVSDSCQHLYPVGREMLSAIASFDGSRVVIFDELGWRLCSNKDGKVEVLNSGAFSGNPVSLFVRQDWLFLAPSSDTVLSLGSSCSYAVYPPNAKYTVLPVCEPFTDSFGRNDGASSLSEWHPTDGEWRIESTVEPQYSTSPYYLSAKSNRGALLYTGQKSDREYLIKAAVRSCLQPTSFGIAAACTDEQSLKAIWRPISGWYGVLEVSEYSSESALWRRPMMVNPMQWYEFQLAISGGKYYFSLDSFPLSSGETTCNSGAAGLFVYGEASFDDVAILPICAFDAEEQYKRGWNEVLAGERVKCKAVPNEFEQDNSMTSWLPSKNDWGYMTEGRSSSIRYKYQVYNDADISFTVTSASRMPSKVMFFENGMNPVEFSISGTNKISIAVSEMGKEVGSTSFDNVVYPLSLMFSVKRDKVSCNAVVAAGLTKNIVCKLMDVSRRGNLSIATRFKPQDINVTSSSLRDYTFATAPVDFERNAGKWMVSSRWACSPQFSWLGGISNPIAAITSKFDIVGDFTIDAHCAPLMVSYMRPGYREPLKIFIEAKGDGSPFSGYSFRTLDNGQNVLYDSSSRARRAVRATTNSSPHWFHNMWLYCSLKYANGSLIGRDMQGSSISISAPPREKGPVSIWFVDNDFSFARLVISAERFEARAPAGLDRTPPGFPKPDKLSAGIHPLITNPMFVVPSEPQSLNIRFEKTNSVNAMVITPDRWGDGFNADLSVQKFSCAEHPVLLMGYDLNTKAEVRLSFTSNEWRFFVPLVEFEQPPIISGEIQIPSEYVERMTFDFFGVQKRLLKVYLGAFADAVLRDGSAQFHSFRLSADLNARPKDAEYKDNENGSLTLFCFDMPASGLQFDALRGKGWRIEKDGTNGNSRQGVVKALSPEGLCALFSPFAHMPKFNATELHKETAILVEMDDPFGILQSSVSVESIVHKTDSMPLLCEGMIRNGDRLSIKIDLNPFFAANPGIHQFDVRVSARNSAGKGDSQVVLKDVKRESFEQNDETAPSFSVNLPVQRLVDNCTEPWLKPFGGPEALFPLAISNKGVWRYSAVKRAIGGYAGFKIGNKPVDTKMYPYLVGTYSSPDFWKLDILNRDSDNTRSFMDYYSERANPVITSGGVSGRWSEDRKILLDLSKFADSNGMIDELRFGDYHFTSSLANWGMVLSDFELVPRLFGENLSFSISAHDVNEVASIEYGVVYIGRTTVLIPPSRIPDTIVTDKQILQFRPTRQGLHYLAVRAKDRRGNVSPFRWIPFDWSQSIEQPPKFLDAQLRPGSACPAAISLMIANVSPASIEIKINGRRLYAQNGVKVESLYNSEAGRVCVFSAPFIATDIGQISIIANATGYTGEIVTKELTVTRDLTAVTQPPAVQAVNVIPDGFLLYDDYELGFGSSSGRRGGLVESVNTVSSGGKRSLLIESLGNYDYFSAFLTTTPYSLRDYPFVEFDYLALNAKMALMVQTESAFYDVRLGDVPVNLYPDHSQKGRFNLENNLGFSSGLIGWSRPNNRGGWVHHKIDLYAMLSNHLKLRGSDIVSHGVAIRAVSGNPVGTRAFVDNFAVCGHAKSFTVNFDIADNLPADSIELVLTILSSGKTVSLSKDILDGNGWVESGIATSGNTRKVRLLNLPVGDYRVDVRTKIHGIFSAPVTASFSSSSK